MANQGKNKPARRPGRDEGVDFQRVVHLLRDQAWLIVACALAGLGLAFAYALRQPPVYVSTAVLEVAEESAPVIGFARHEGSDLNSASLLKTIEQTVASQSVLRRVIEKRRLADDPTFAPPRKSGPYGEAELLELLQNRLRVDLVRGTRLIALLAWDSDPVKAQGLAQGVIDEFFAQKHEAGREGVDAARRYLTVEAARVKDELTASEERLQLYREKHNAVSLSDRHNLVMGRLDDLSRQVTLARSERLALETEKIQVEALQRQGGQALLNIRAIAAQPDIVELLKNVNLLASEVAALEQRYRAKHPRMIESARQLTETRGALETALQRSGDAIIQAHRTALATEEILRREYDRQETLALELARISIPYRALEREAESNQILYQQMLERLKQADVTQGLLAVGDVEGSRIRVTQEPLVPVRPGGMSKKVLLALGLFGGAALGVGVAVARRALDNSLPSVDEAEDYLGLPSLAVIHRSTLGDLREGAVIDSHPATLEAEAFRSLRTALSLLQPQESGRGVMFTSAMQGEGKSFCSRNYAASVAQQGLRTLLIDGDLRRAWLRAALAPGAVGPGLTECLRDPDLLSAAIQPTGTPHLSVLGDLRGSTRGAELLAGDNLAAIIARCRHDFDRVVIDTAPVTAVSDALHFARHIGTICLVVHAGMTARRTVRRACTLLENTTGNPPAGIVFNQVGRGRAGAYYYYANGEAYADAKPVPALRGAFNFIRSLRHSLTASVSARRS